MRWMILAVGLVSASGLAAQQTTAPQAASLTDAQRMLETRADLEALLAELRETAASTAYSETLRARARGEARLRPAASHVEVAGDGRFDAGPVDFVPAHRGPSS